MTHNNLDLEDFRARQNVPLMNPNNRVNSQNTLSGLLFIPFMIADLIYGYSDYECVKTIPSAVSFNLGTWFKVDGYFKLFFLLFICAWLVLIIALSRRQQLIIGIACLGGCIFVVGIIFNLIWLIVGAVMYWGQLGDNCQTSVKIYMNFLLIVNFGGICCNLCCGQSNRI